MSNEGALRDLHLRLQSVEEFLELKRDHRFTRLEEWAHERGLLTASTDKQVIKMLEEAGEVARWVLRGGHEQVIDAIGDTITTLVILAAQIGTTGEECLDAAWEEIKDRDGQIINGTFVKDGDHASDQVN